ncbi:sodium:solute symporter family protein [Papillibacter cinnamivorans]|uniref:Solute:Na+ symporter, SSS family n=1 Tax=Papillibacter cinnamivorans DSM 12816 TaxID=1122930 RepID=A0A1W2AI96_9FIRM|nr:sodium:solute symporter family protein [Papillibacter cinnamivorans]SMC60406.1 solute:Na+ symporter, SSS family [Papillibacter cinnamivorans DSM 12816]
MYVYAAVAVVIFLIFLFGIGVWTKKFVANSSDYLLAGREMSYGINMMGVVASGFAGTTIALAPGWGVIYGFWGTFAMAFCYAICGVCVYGLLFAKVIRRSGAYTLPEWLEMRYDYRVRRVLAITGFIGMIAVTANNVLALANVLTGYFGWSLYISIAIGVLTFMGFTYFSGMWGVSLTDFAQALIGCVGAPLLIIFCFKTFGGLDVTFRAWNGTFADYFTAGIGGTSLKMWGLAYPSGITIALNFGVFLVWGGQHYWIRMASARSEKQAQFGYVVAGVILFFVTLVIGMVGLYAGAHYGDMFTLTGGTIPPTSAYGYVISYFPPLVGVFLLVFALAASLSTAASTLIGSVSIAVKDIYPHFIHKNPSDKQLARAGRVATVVISLIAWGLAYYPGGTTFLFAFATAWMAPAGLMFALGLWWRRCTPTGAFVGAIIALICESAWALLDLFKVPVGGHVIGFYFHMGIVGLVTAIIPAVIVSLLTKPKYYGRPDWALKDPSAGQTAIRQ